MDEKPTAGLATAIIVVPLMALCCLGPLFIGSIVGGFVSWLDGQGAFVIVVIALVAGLASYALVRWRRSSARSGGEGLACPCDASREGASHTADPTGHGEMSRADESNDLRLPVSKPR